MYIKDMLDQVAKRDSDQTEIENFLRQDRNLSALLQEPAVSRIIAELGTEALSDRALDLVAAQLHKSSSDHLHHLA
jgi:histone H3/H4